MMFGWFSWTSWWSAAAATVPIVSANAASSPANTFVAPCSPNAFAASVAPGPKTTASTSPPSERAFVKISSVVLKPVESCAGSPYTQIFAI